MLKSLIRILPFIVAMILSIIIYLRIDKKCLITDKISSKLRVRKVAQPALVACVSMGLIFIIGLIGIYVIDLPSIVYFIISGIIAGASSVISNKLSIASKNR